MKSKAIAGILATLLMVNILLFAVPTTKGQFVGTIKLGIIGPWGLPHWSPAGMKEAAEMARDEINAAGGIALEDGDYRVEITLGNEYALPVPNPDAAKAELQRLVLVEGCKTIIGGFRDEVTSALVDEAANLKVLFLINGASTDELINQTVGLNYAKFKYIFRNNPVRVSTLFYCMGAFIQYVVSMKMLPIYGYVRPGMVVPQVPIAVLSEDLAWTQAGYFLLTNPAFYPLVFGPYVNVTYAARIPETATDLKTWLDAVDASGAAIMLILVSGRVGLPLIQQWGARNMKAIPYGINILGQLEEHWIQTNQKCHLEGFLDFAGTRTPIIGGEGGKTTQFWDAFVTRTGRWPIYTAWGAYDTMGGFKDILEDHNGRFHNVTGAVAKTPDDLVKIYETGFAAGYRIGLSGKFKFTSIHDSYTEEIDHYWNNSYVRAFNVQWQDGVKEVVSPFYNGTAGTFFTYARKYKLNPLSYPSGYEGMADTDTVSHPGQNPSAPNPLLPPYSVDRKIDAKDIAMATGSIWLSYPGHPAWNFNADLDNNQLIDIIDVATIATDWGKTIGAPITW